MSRLLLTALIAVPCWMPLSAGPAIAAQTGTWVWEDVPRVVALGDLHGTYDKMIALLEGTGLVDDDLAWIGGEDHLVLTGDLVDRGPDDRKVLDFARRLSGEAAAAGGRVHMLLGNHEAMNLLRDLRYVDPEGFAAFAQEESAKERRQALKRYRAAHRRSGHSSAQIEATFDQLYPPGFLARVEAFALDGEYGSWIMEQPAAVMVNGLVFVHGGLTEEVAALGLDEINRTVREKMRATVRQIEVLVPLVQAPATFHDVYDLALAIREKGLGEEVDPRLVAAAETVLGVMQELPFRADGPLWYRGNALEDERIERERIDRNLELLGARAMVVAHTPTGEGHITSRYDGRLFRTDVGMAYGREPLALVFDNGAPQVYDPRTGTMAVPELEAPAGEGKPRAIVELPDSEMETLLTEAEIVARRELGRGSTRPQLLELRLGEVEVRGLFKWLDEARAGASPAATTVDRYQHEVAAYWLDRLLGLGLVPVAVLRTVAGMEGSLQLWVEGAVSQDWAEANVVSAADWDRLAAQARAVRLFDALIANEGREGEDILMHPEKGRVYLVDHSKAFTLSTEVPPATELVCEPTSTQALRSLDPDRVRTELSPLLGSEELEALLARRLKILARCNDFAHSDQVEAGTEAGGL